MRKIIALFLALCCLFVGSTGVTVAADSGMTMTARLMRVQNGDVIDQKLVVTGEASGMANDRIVLNVLNPGMTWDTPLSDEVTYGNIL